MLKPPCPVSGVHILRKGLFLCLILVASCSDPDPVYGPVTGDFSNIQDPHERWQAYGLTDYRVLERRSCFCPAPYAWMTYVKDGKVAAVRVVDPQDPTDAMRKNALASAWTIEEAFARAAEVENADIHSVEYDERYGFPTRIFRDYEGVTDASLSLGTEDLEAVLRW
jgi:hypothetical protein